MDTRTCWIDNHDPTQPVEVYKYRPNGKYSSLWAIRQNGEVIGGAGRVWLRDVQFIVQPEGRDDLLLNDHRTIHAWVSGILNALGPHSGSDSDPPGRDEWGREVHYWPERAATFIFLDGTPIHHADSCFLGFRKLFV